MGMYLMRSIAGEGVYRSQLPDFMVFLDWKTLPWYWHGFQNFPFAAVMCLAAPGLLALVFGWFMFRSRIRGVYLSIVTQALTYAATLFFFQNAAGFGGNNGLTDFKRLLGASLHDPATRKTLYVASALALFGTYLLCRFIVTSRLGRVVTAVRDAELKSRFCGYESTNYKLFIWTLSAMLCALAGALYVPQVGIINPSEMQPSNSIEMAIWVAVGGRATLFGAVLGRLAGQRRQELAHGSAALGVALRAGRAVRSGHALLARRPGGAERAHQGQAGGARQCQDNRSGDDGDRRCRGPTGPATNMSAQPVIPMQDPQDDRPTPISNLPIPEGAKPSLALWVENLSVSFDGFKALTDVTLTLEQGELRCLIGPNGAGKTTLMDCITGKTRPDSGAVYLGSRLDNLTRLSEVRDRAARHRAQIPAPDGLPGAHGLREPASWR